MLMKKAKNKRFWKKVRTNAKYREVIEQIREFYETTRYEEIPSLSYASRMRYYDDGDRSEFERPYFRRRTCVSALGLMALIYPENERYLKELQELIWAICEEYSWVLPAHCGNDLEDSLTRIDLFSAETGFTLAEICYMLEDRLDKLILDRVRAEVEKRILYNYENGNFWWETTTNNWSAVCAGNVGGALMYLFPKEFKRLMPRLVDTMLCLLDGFPEDGTCLEGFSYWHYGFGNYVWFADLLKQFTDGEIDLMKKEKVEQISGYAQRTFLCGNTTVSFSDGSRTGSVNKMMQNYLADIFPDSVHPLPAEITSYPRGNVMWQNFFRNVYYMDLMQEPQELQKTDIDLQDAGQVIINRENYSLAVKAGDNEEPHNHNDIGNFIVATKEGQIFCDLGAGRYTRQYFDPETRYTIFCNGSQSHNVPIINGTYQKEGKNYAGTIFHEGGKITVEMAGAYEAGTIEKLTREFIYNENSFQLTDKFTPGYESLIERFVTLETPEIFEDHVIVKGVKLTFDPEMAKVRVTKESHENHDLSISVINCIDFELAKGLETVTFGFEVV